MFIRIGGGGILFIKDKIKILRACKYGECPVCKSIAVRLYLVQLEAEGVMCFDCFDRKAGKLIAEDVRKRIAQEDENVSV